jgi:hypothetical protein
MTMVPAEAAMVPLPLIVKVGYAESVIPEGMTKGGNSLLGSEQLQVIPNTEFCDVNPRVTV